MILDAKIKTNANERNEKQNNPNDHGGSAGSAACHGGSF